MSEWLLPKILLCSVVYRPFTTYRTILLISHESMETKNQFSWIKFPQFVRVFRLSTLTLGYMNGTASDNNTSFNPTFRYHE